VNRSNAISWILKGLFLNSLLFIILYLIKLEWLEIPVIYSLSSLIISILLLLFGFMLDASAWLVMIRAGISSISFRDAIISSGKYIFAKYIPGKFWIILGKAGYLKEKYGNSLIILSSYSIIYQVLGIITAILLSLGVTSVINRTLFYTLLAIIIISILFCFSFRNSLCRLYLHFFHGC